MKEPDFFGKKSIFPYMAKMGPNWPKIEFFRVFGKFCHHFLEEVM